MSQKEMVMKLWAVKCTLNQVKIDLQSVSNTLRLWQQESIAKGLKANPVELTDSVLMMWYANVLQLAQDNVGKVHDRLENDMVINC